MITETVIPRVAANVVAKMVDDNIVLVTPKQGKVRVLNDAGSSAWSLIDGSRSFGDICDSLTDEYVTQRDVVKADLDKFVTEMKQYGVLILDA